MAPNNTPNDSNDLALTVLATVAGVGLLAVVFAPGFVSATVGGALTAAGGYLLKKGFGR